jgi:hypothetical protein
VFDRVFVRFLLLLPVAGNWSNISPDVPLNCFSSRSFGALAQPRQGSALSATYAVADQGADTDK